MCVCVCFPKSQFVFHSFFSFCLRCSLYTSHTQRIFFSSRQDGDEWLQGGPGEPQLRFHQDKGKGKLFTLRGRSRLAANVWPQIEDEGQKIKEKKTSIWKMEELTSANCLCL